MLLFPSFTVYALLTSRLVSVNLLNVGISTAITHLAVISVFESNTGPRKSIGLGIIVLFKQAWIRSLSSSGKECFDASR